MFRHALRSADGITCVSNPLARYVRQSSSYSGPVEVIENAVPDGLFYPMEKTACRRKLGLPPDGIFIVAAGAISCSRGIETLFRAFEILASNRSDVHLVLAGTCDKGLTLPESQRFHYAGVLPPEKIPVFLSSLDINVICNRDSAFGRYCFPQKFHEAVACRVPVVAAATGAMKELLAGKPQCLFEPDNVDDLVAALRGQLARPTVLNRHVPTWDELGARLSGFLEGVGRRKS